MNHPEWHTDSMLAQKSHQEAKGLPQPFEHGIPSVMRINGDAEEEEIPMHVPKNEWARGHSHHDSRLEARVKPRSPDRKNTPVIEFEGPMATSTHTSFVPSVQRRMEQQCGGGAAAGVRTTIPHPKYSKKTSEVREAEDAEARRPTGRPLRPTPSPIATGRRGSGVRGGRRLSSSGGGTPGTRGGSPRPETGRPETGRLDTGRLDTGRLDTAASRLDTAATRFLDAAVGRLDKAMPAAGHSRLFTGPSYTVSRDEHHSLSSGRPHTHVSTSLHREAHDRNYCAGLASPRIH